MALRGHGEYRKWSYYYRSRYAMGWSRCHKPGCYEPCDYEPSSYEPHGYVPRSNKPCGYKPAVISPRLYSTMGAMSASERGSFPASAFEWSSSNDGFLESWWARALREISFVTLAVTVDQKEKKSNTCSVSNPQLRRENSHPKSNALTIKLTRHGQNNKANRPF